MAIVHANPRFNHTVHSVITKANALKLKQIKHGRTPHILPIHCLSYFFWVGASTSKSDSTPVVTFFSSDHWAILKQTSQSPSWLLILWCYTLPPRNSHNYKQWWNIWWGLSSIFTKLCLDISRDWFQGQKLFSFVHFVYNRGMWADNLFHVYKARFWYQMQVLNFVSGCPPPH